MALPVKHVMYFKDSSGYGYSEIHYKMSAGEVPDLEVELNLLKTSVAPKRAALLGEDVVLNGLRVSYRRTNGVASLPDNPFMPGVGGQKSASETVSLNLGWTDGTKSKRKTTSLRGIWDGIETNGEYHPDHEAAADWKPRLTLYTDTLIQLGYGWPSRDVNLSSKGRVTGYVVGVDGRITFTLADLGVDPEPTEHIQMVRFSRLNNGKSPLNRTLLVELVNANTLRTIEQVAAGPFTTPGKWNLRIPTVVAYSKVATFKMGRRKPGRPSSLSPGRSKGRAKY